MEKYQFITSKSAFERAETYLFKLQNGIAPGKILADKIRDVALNSLTVEELLQALVATKKPQIFAETDVIGDGSDWTIEELSLLGDLNIAMGVRIFDNGNHTSPLIHSEPFAGHLVFVPGALLQSFGKNLPVDWKEVVTNNEIDPSGYYRLYKRRLMPAFSYINEKAEELGQKALVTVPGIGCGQFAGPFKGQLGERLKEVLLKLLEENVGDFPFIRAIYYDSFMECENERFESGGTSLMVRPLLRGNDHKSQLCAPTTFQDEDDDFSECHLFSLVAWDHVSWPGNDFFAGSRMTDDGVKAAATDSMKVVTGVEGHYNRQLKCYLPPTQYKIWCEVVERNGLVLKLKGNLKVY